MIKILHCLVFCFNGFAIHRIVLHLCYLVAGVSVGHHRRQAGAFWNRMVGSEL